VFDITATIITHTGNNRVPNNRDEAARATARGATEAWKLD